MRTPHRTSLREATTAPAQEIVIPPGRHPVPTHTRLRTRRLPVVMYVAALLLLPGLVVVGFISSGLWATTGSSASAQPGEVSGEGGTGHAAPADPADVKGSMTVQQVVDAFPPMTAAQFLTKLDAPLDTPTSTQLKTLVEGGNVIDMAGVRTWLQEQAGG